MPGTRDLGLDVSAVSRSRKKTPIANIGAVSNAPFKRQANKRYRGAVRQALRRQMSEFDPLWLLPILREKSDPWNSPGDGKRWYHLPEQVHQSLEAESEAEQAVEMEEADRQAEQYWAEQGR